MNAHRHFSLYFSWDKPHESGKTLSKLDERFPALFELRRAVWPNLEGLESGPQGIEEFLNRIVLGDFERFRDVVEDECGVRPVLVSAVESDGTRHTLQSVLSGNVDTCIVISLDHIESEQTPCSADIETARTFLQRPEAVLAVCLHHHVGANTDNEFTNAEYRHHGDSLVPAHQKLGGYGRMLLDALGIPVVNSYGLRPATAPDGEPLPLDIAADQDELHLLGGGGRLPVRTFNAHGHLPHLQPGEVGATAYRILARQPIDTEAPPHPFAQGDSPHFNALLWAPPMGTRRGHVLVCDATIWSNAFRGLSSLENFWRNLAAMPVK